MAVQKIDNLNIHENPATNENEFDVENYLNVNWNKIKTVVNNNADELNTAQENISDIQEEQETQNTKIETLETDNTTNKKDISDLKEENETQETSIEELQENLENTKNELSDAQQEIEALKTIQNALPTIDGEGENLTLKGTAENTTFKKFQICGNSRQETREGYNLIDIVNSSLMGQDKGVTIEISDDGYITANGTPTTAYTVFISKNVTNLLEDGQTYSIWQENYSDNDLGEIYSQIIANPVSGSSSTQQFFTSGKNRKTFTVDKSNYTYTWNIQVATLNLAGTFDNYKNRYMLYKGTDNKEKFELYGAMPSPNFSSKIEAVGDDTNQFNKDEVVLKDGYYSSVDGSFVTSTATCHTENYIEVISNANHILSGFKRHSSDYDYSSVYAIYFYDNEKNWISRTSAFYTSNSAPINEYLEYQFKTPSGCRYIRFQCQTTEINLDLDTIKLQKGEKATAYSKFGEGTASAKISNKNIARNITYFNTKNQYASMVNLEYYFEKDKNYRISFDTPNTGIQIYLQGQGDDTNYSTETWQSCYCDGERHSFKVTGRKTKNTKITWGLICRNTATSDVESGLLSNLMIEEVESSSSSATDYVEHQEQNFTMPCQKEMLEEDYFDLDTLEEAHIWDKLIVDGVNNKFNSSNINGDSRWFRYNGGSWDSTSSITTTNIKSSHFITETSWNKGTCYGKYTSNGFSLQVMMNDATLTNVNDGNNWAKSQNEAGTPLTFYYKLQQEERLPMTSEQIAVAKQIKNTLVSYKDTTHIYSEDSISPIFKCSAIADMTAMLDNLQAQILANEEV